MPFLSLDRAGQSLSLAAYIIADKWQRTAGMHLNNRVTESPNHLIVLKYRILGQDTKIAPKTEQ